jgi:glutaredoxin
MWTKEVRVFVADGCHLCEAALEVVSAVCSELGVAFEAVDISADAELERRYRERIPVVTVDGEVAFTYFVDPQSLREQLRA